MPRKKHIPPLEDLHIKLSQEELGRLVIALHSDTEGRIPYGLITGFFRERLREYFDRRSVDLAPFLHGLAPGSVIYGSASLIERLESFLRDTTRDAL